MIALPSQGRSGLHHVEEGEDIGAEGALELGLVMLAIISWGCCSAALLTRMSSRPSSCTMSRTTLQAEVPRRPHRRR